MLLSSIWDLKDCGVYLILIKNKTENHGEILKVTDPNPFVQ
jgi:hypothetical protein